MREIFNSHPVSVLKKEISKTNIKGYSKMKKGQIVDLMMKNKERFKHIKMAEKKAPAPAKKPTTPPPKKKKIKLNVLPKTPPKAKKVKLNVLPKTPPKAKTPSSSPSSSARVGPKEKPRTKEQMEFIEMVRKNDDDPDFKGNKLFPYDIPKAKESAKKKIGNIYKKATDLRIVYGQPIISKKLNFLIEMVFAFTDIPISKVEKIYNDYLKRLGLPPIKAKTPPKATEKQVDDFIKKVRFDERDEKGARYLGLEKTREGYLGNAATKQKLKFEDTTKKRLGALFRKAMGRPLKRVTSREMEDIVRLVLKKAQVPLDKVKEVYDEYLSNLKRTDY
jgi:hypothetical protein